MDLNNLKGIGEKTEKLFYKAGIEKVNDLLRYYPRYYEIWNVTELRQLRELS